MLSAHMSVVLPLVKDTLHAGVRDFGILVCSIHQWSARLSSSVKLHHCQYD